MVLAVFWVGTGEYYMGCTILCVVYGQVELNHAQNTLCNLCIVHNADLSKCAQQRGRQRSE